MQRRIALAVALTLTAALGAVVFVTAGFHENKGAAAPSATQIIEIVETGGVPGSSSDAPAAPQLADAAAGDADEPGGEEEHEEDGEEDRGEREEDEQWEFDDND